MIIIIIIIIIIILIIILNLDTNNNNYSLWHTLAAYTPGLQYTLPVDQYAHYRAAGFEMSEIYQLYAEPLHVDQHGNKGLIMEVDPTIAKIFVGAQGADETTGLNLIFHLGNNGHTHVEVVLAAKTGKKEIFGKELKQ